MGTAGRNDFRGDRSRLMDGLDVDAGAEIAQIMPEARQATEAVRQSTAALLQSSSSAAGTRRELAAPARINADGMRPESEWELGTAGFVVELERLANGLRGADGTDEAGTRLKEDESHVTSAADPAEKLLRNMWAEHASLTQTVSQLQAAVAEAEASIDAFKHAMRRLEEAAGDSVNSNETVTSLLPSRAVDSRAGRSAPDPGRSAPDPGRSAPDRLGERARPSPYPVRPRTGSRPPWLC